MKRKALTGKNARLKKSASKQIEDDEIGNLLSTSSSSSSSDSSSTLILKINNFINRSIKFHKVTKEYSLILIGAFVTLYSLHQIELKIKYFLFSLNIFGLLTLALLIGFLVYLIKNSNQLIFTTSSTIRSASSANLINFFKKKENYFQIFMVLMIILSIFIFYSQIRSIGKLNKKLAFKKEQHQQHLVSQNETNLNNETLSIPIGDFLERFNETEYIKEQVFYDNLFLKLKRLHESLHNNDSNVNNENNDVNIKIIRRYFKADNLNYCKARTFYDVINFVNSDKNSRNFKGLTRSNLSINNSKIENRKFIIFSKIENIWLVVFKTILITYGFLLVIYFVISFMINYLNEFDKSQNYHLTNQNVEKQFSLNNTVGILKKERPLSTSTVQIAKKYDEGDIVRENSEQQQQIVQFIQHELSQKQQNQHNNHQFRKNNSGNIKKVASLTSLRSEHARSVKLLQKLQQTYQTRDDNDDDDDDDDDNIDDTDDSITDFEPLKWLLNENNVKLIENINSLFKDTLNTQSKIKNEANSTVNEEEFVFQHVETLPPKVTNLRNEITANDNLTLKARVEFYSIDLSIVYKNKKLQPQQRTIEIKLLNLCGQLVIILNQNKTNESFNLDICFDKTVDILYKIQDEKLCGLSPSSLKNLENIIKSAIKQASVTFDLNILNQSANLSQLNNSSRNSQYPPTSSYSSSSPAYRKDAIETASSNSIIKDHNELINNNNNNNNLNEKRLLVKILKATNLTNCEEPYCVIELDNPVQKHVTHVFEDINCISEKFLFDITNYSEELTFSVYDRNKNYGNDLVGEVVLPVSDLCGNLASKRFIQLHKYGTTKTGTLTVEFLFSEPMSTLSQQNSFKTHQTSSILQNDKRRENNDIDTSIQRTESVQNSSKSQDSLKPGNIITKAAYNPYIKQYEPSDLTMTESMDSNDPTQMLKYNQKQAFNSLNQHNSYETPVNIEQNRFNNSSQIQSIDDASKRVINRNYLHVKPNANNSGPLVTSVTTSLVNNSNGNLTGDENYGNSKSDDVKRRKSISRSLRSLFVRSANNDGHKKHKREQSMDSHHTFNSVHQDVQSELNFKKTKSISGSLKRIFSRKKNNKTNNTNNAGMGNTNEPINMTVSRPIRAADLNNPNGYKKTQTIENTDNQQQDTLKYYKEDMAFRNEPLTLRKAFRLP